MNFKKNAHFTCDRGVAPRGGELWPPRRVLAVPATTSVSVRIQGFQLGGRPFFSASAFHSVFQNMKDTIV
jgi:hypothetical protein